MSNRFKQEMQKINTPKELHQRSKLGIQLAKREMEGNNEYKRGIKKPLVLASSLIIILLVSITLTNQKLDQGTRTTKNKLEENVINNPKKYTDTENTTVIRQRVDMAVLYNSVKKLAKRADIVIQGTVLSTDVFKYKGNLFTEAKVKVSDRYEGHTEKGKVLTFVEIGGITTRKNLKAGNNVKDFNDNFNVPHLSENDELKKRVEVVYGTPVMKPNEKVVIFGSQSKHGMYEDKVGEQYYGPVGAYQGKFRVSGYSIKRTVPKGASDRYRSLKMTKAKLKKIIKNLN